MGRSMPHGAHLRLKTHMQLRLINKVAPQSNSIIYSKRDSAVYSMVNKKQNHKKTVKKESGSPGIGCGQNDGCVFVR